MKIKVSVIVPVYNTERYLRRCLKSLVGQSLKEMEIILVNDCSTDHSLDIIEEYKREYPEKISVIDLKENKGPGGARNEGIAIAKGEYIGFTDSDDDVSSCMFEKLYKAADETSSDMVDCKFYHEAFDRVMKTTNESALGELDMEKRREIFIHSGYIWSKIIKREIVIENNIRFRENAAYEDIDFIRTAIFYCRRAAFIDEVLYNYRDNEVSLTSQKTKEMQIYQKMEAMRNLTSKFKTLGAYDDYKAEIIYLVYKTYAVMLNYTTMMEKTEADIDLFKELHDYFTELSDDSYKSNSYIMQMNEDDRLLVDINNENYTNLYSMLFE